jgi:SDR family mycofactocin-dependent oxidoreductase
MQRANSNDHGGPLFTGRLDGKVAFVTGAARGQGRSHALRLAELGADLVVVDRCENLELITYEQPGPEALAETVRLVEARGRRAHSVICDVRDHQAMNEAVRQGVELLGRIDVVVANAGVIQLKPALHITVEDWNEVISINLTGTWNTISAALPALVEQDDGGSIVVISSAAGVKGPPNMAHYAASKSGVIGLVKSLASELGPHRIRVNAVLPTTVDTEMVHWQGAYEMFRPDLVSPGRADVSDIFASLNTMPVPWIESCDVTEVVAWLAGDRSRYVTGISMPVDAGTLVK